MLLLIQLISPTRKFLGMLVTTTKIGRYTSLWIFNMKMYIVNAKQFAAKCHVVVMSDDFTCFMYILNIYPGNLCIRNMLVCKKNLITRLSSFTLIIGSLCNQYDFYEE